MSVLKSKRHKSTAEYVNVADDIFVEVMDFLLKMSLRYQRLLAQDTMNMASKVLDHAEMANNIRIADKASFDLRYKHLMEARTAVMALDVHMSYIRDILDKNPQGAFTNTKGETKPAGEAKKILNDMAYSLGDKVDVLKNLISGVIASDKKRYKKL